MNSIHFLNKISRARFAKKATQAKSDSIIRSAFGGSIFIRHFMSIHTSVAAGRERPVKSKKLVPLREIDAGQVSEPEG